MLLGFILLFLAARRKEQHEDVSHQAPAVGPPIAPPSPVPAVQVPAPPTIADSPQEVKLPPNREIIDATPDYLVALFDQHTSIQAQRLIEPYIGKWMIVSGRLRDIADHGHGSQLTFESSAINEFGVVFMWFRQPDRSDRLSVLRRGTELTVLGQIRWVNKIEVNLDNCELV
jgi:putative nucleic acid binding protein